MKKGFFVLSILLFSIAIIQAQDSTCTPETTAILEQMEAVCETIGRNQVCYANNHIDSEISDGEFDLVGQTIPVENLISLQTSPYIPETEEWGIAIFNIQANLPDTLPGQLVTMIVYGDTNVEIDEDAPDDYANPMQAFLLTTGIGEPGCEDVPDSGLLIQNSSGETINLLINGFELEINSTALFSAETRRELTVTTFEGLIHIQQDGEVVTVPEGFSIHVQQNEEFVEPVPEPEFPAGGIPSGLLPEGIPEIGIPSVESIGFLDCSGQGGIDIATGSIVMLRGGWAETSITDLLAFVSVYVPSASFDGNPQTHNYRSGPAPWENGDQTGFRYDWYWAFPGISAGTHVAEWLVAGESVSCEIRAS